MKRNLSLKDFKVGDIVYVYRLPHTNATHYSVLHNTSYDDPRLIVEAMVVSVGIKFVSSDKYGKFCIPQGDSNGPDCLECANSRDGYLLFKDRESAEKEGKRKLLQREVDNYFRSFNHYTYEQLAAIKEIISPADSDVSVK